MSSKRDLLILLLIGLLLTFIRIFYIYTNQLNLYPDEAQYWLWSTNLEAGYYSKPPVIAWLIRLTTSLFGNSEFAIRLMAPILHLFTSIIIYFLSITLVRDGVIAVKAALWAGLAYLTLPVVTLSSALITTDIPLIFCWALSMLAFIHACREPNGLILWLFAGVAAGIGCLSKYTMFMIIPSIMLYLYSVHKGSYLHWRGFVVASIIALTCYLPNLLWNIENDFVSYQHTHEISQVENIAVKPLQLLNFILVQFVMLGPLMMFAFLKNVTAISRNKIFYFIWPTLVVVLVLGLFGKALPNWGAPIYISIVMCCIIHLYLTGQHNIVKWIVASNCLLSIIFYLYSSAVMIMPDLPDPFKHMRGWSELGQQVELVAQEYPDVPWLVTERKLIAELKYYAPSLDVSKLMLEGRVHDYYDMKYGIKNAPNKFIILVKKENIGKILNKITNAKVVKQDEIKLGRAMHIKYYLMTKTQ
jgi:4-amino-4-deoxy-L-arabinose transferase-like glycosyltransferase